MLSKSAFNSHRFLIQFRFNDDVKIYDLANHRLRRRYKIVRFIIQPMMSAKAAN